VGEQPLERQVQPRQAVARRIPRLGQRRGEVDLLGDDVRRPVAHALRLDQHHQAVGRDEVEQHLLVVDEPRQPGLHAVEELALRQPVPLLASPRLGREQLLRPGAHPGPRQQLAGREERDLAERDGGALVVDPELVEPVDLVAPQVDAHRRVGGGGEDVDDGAAHGDLTAVLHLVLAPVAEADETRDEIGAVHHVALTDDDRIDLGVTQPLHQRSRRRHEHRRRAFGVTQVPQRLHPPAHRLDAGADPLERQGLPGREGHDRVGPEVEREVVGQPFGVAGGRNRHDEGSAFGHADERRERGRPSRFGHGQHGGAAAEHRFEGGIAGEQRGDGREWRGGEGREGRGCHAIGLGSSDVRGGAGGATVRSWWAR
jgi:hypothetical protein